MGSSDIANALNSPRTNSPYFPHLEGSGLRFVLPDSVVESVKYPIKSRQT
jgi:hypothetical protein